jgi:hypothetical protein
MTAEYHAVSHGGLGDHGGGVADDGEALPIVARHERRRGEDVIDFTLA